MPFEVGLGSDDSPYLKPSCACYDGDAVPGIRFQYLLGAFPGQSSFASICSNIGVELREMSVALREALYNPQCH